MTLNKVIEALRKEYENARKQRHIRKPLSYALYQVWHKQEREEKERNQKNV